MTLVKGAIAAAVFALAGGVANAATVTTTFDLTMFSGQFANQLTATSADGRVGLTIDALWYRNISTIGNNADITKTVGIGINNNGLGVCEANGAGNNCKGGDQLDGGSNKSSTDNEMLRFTFSGVGAPVTVNSISWFNNDTNDNVDLFAGSTLKYIKQFNAVSPPSRTDPLAGYFSLAGFDAVSVFAVGLQDKSDELRVTQLSVSYDDGVTPAPVPLPAAGLLLLGGVGTLAGMRRRKRT